MNFLAILLAAVIPMALGFVYYHPAVAGRAWMAAAGLTPDYQKKGNMAVIFLVSLLLSFLLAVQVNFLVIHQSHVQSLVSDEPGFMQEGSEVMNDMNAFLDKYGDSFRTFRHGAFHGILSGIFFVLPVLGINALFERKGFKYIAINCVFWILSLALMGGVICSWT